jgi:hypothetical protein
MRKRKSSLSPKDEAHVIEAKRRSVLEQLKELLNGFKMPEQS